MELIFNNKITEILDSYECENDNDNLYFDLSKSKSKHPNLINISESYLICSYLLGLGPCEEIIDNKLYKEIVDDYIKLYSNNNFIISNKVKLYNKGRRIAELAY